jgi:hypothetical protein
VSLRLVPAALVAVALSSLAGCAAKLNEVRSYTVKPEEGEGFVIPSQGKAQTISIEFTADNDVTVLLFKAADAKGNDAVDADEKKALGFKKGKSGSFTADVPENTETRLVVRGATKTTKVDVKVKN